LRAEIIGVGTEILLGQIPNSNARWMSERLAEIGVDVLHHQAVGDNVERIRDAFLLGLSRSEVLISTGGLGPTQDDITRDGLASALNVGLVRHPEIEDLLRAKFARIGRDMPEANLVQADVPDGARWISPRRGTAPGLACEAPEGRRVYCVPGVPEEMTEMMEGSILPELAALSGPAAIASRVIRCTGIAESKVAEMLDDLFRSETNPTVAFLASAGEVKVRLTAKAATRQEAESLIRPVEDEVCARIGDPVFTRDDEELEGAVGRLARDAGRTIACAESLTGGNVGARLTSIPGASDYFLGSAVCYATESKVTILGVSPNTVRGDGVVSARCALEMAAGARRLYGADIGLALTGVAGPDPQEGLRRGQVFVGIEADGVSYARGFTGPGDRMQVRRWAEQAAMDLARRHLEGKPFQE
jgi:nicotinamide-nucleotide amidase